MVLQFILTFLMSFSLQNLWDLMNGLALMVYLPMFNVIFPSNFNILNNKLINIVTFDLVPFIDDINDYFFTTFYSEGPIG